MSAKIVEAVAEEFHNIWVHWSKTIAKEEQISTKRYLRWQKLWVPYAQLPEKRKETDRELARRILRLMGSEH